MLLTVACPEPAQTPVDLIEKIILCEANYGHFKGCCHLGPQGFGEQIDALFQYQSCTSQNTPGKSQQLGCKRF